MKSLVKNVPAYAKDYEYWVVTDIDGELWFYGAYSDRNKANEVALQLGKEVVVE